MLSAIKGAHFVSVQRELNIDTDDQHRHNHFVQISSKVDGSSFHRKMSIKWSTIQCNFIRHFLHKHYFVEKQMNHLNEKH